eukprot:1833125-Rhodomonas_salina.2
MFWSHLLRPLRESSGHHPLTWSANRTLKAPSTSYFNLNFVVSGLTRTDSSGTNLVDSTRVAWCWAQQECQFHTSTAYAYPGPVGRDGTGTKSLRLKKGARKALPPFNVGQRNRPILALPSDEIAYHSTRVPDDPRGRGS